MISQDRRDEAWYIALTRDGGGEYHHLSKDALVEQLTEEWNREYNGIFVGRDIDCEGRLLIFFRGQDAQVFYEDFVNGRWLSSYNPTVSNESDRAELVRLSPENTEESSFPRYSIISKARLSRLFDSIWILARSMGYTCWMRKVG